MFCIAGTSGESVEDVEDKDVEDDVQLLSRVLNGCKVVKEVEEKCGYDKEWDWYGDTALIASARAGHDEIVRIELQQLELELVIVK